jgi:N-acetylneuraminic acid mutarotase
MSDLVGQMALVKISQFPGEARYGTVTFSFMGKGYLACGINQDFNRYNYLTDFWEYDYINDSWIQINTNYPGEGRINMIAGVIENKIIMGLGAGKDGGGNRLDDIWEYTPEQK